MSADFGVAAGAEPGPGAGIAVKDGATTRLLVSSHLGSYSNDYITTSTDTGRSWRTNNKSFPKMDESTLADLGGGHLLANFRHKGEKTQGRGVSRSSDFGSSWSKITFEKELRAKLHKNEIYRDQLLRAGRQAG